MSIERITIAGLRGFSHEQVVQLAMPNGKPGSGITVLVGTNNSGKSSVIESFRAVASQNPPSFSEGKRNRLHGDNVKIRIDLTGGAFREIRSIHPNGSETEALSGSISSTGIVVVQARRSFSPFFSRIDYLPSKEQYSNGPQISATREPSITGFEARLFEIYRDEEKRRVFDSLVARIVGYQPKWTIDQADAGNYYLKFIWPDSQGVDQFHSSDGLGEGMISLFVILDAIRDLDQSSTLVIDEPELSLHPQYQRRLRALISELASTRQIVYATHSPFFIDWDDVSSGAHVHRIHKTQQGSLVASPSRQSVEGFIKLGQNNIYNPHVLGLQANEALFLEGTILLLEGQEDVVVLPRVMGDLGFEIPVSYFGWGVGGANNMTTVCQLLQELGFESVVGILDADKIDEVAPLRNRFPGYLFESIEADDIRAKPARPATVAKQGLLGPDGHVRPEFESTTRELLEKIASYVDVALSEREIV